MKLACVGLLIVLPCLASATEAPSSQNATVLRDDVRKVCEWLLLSDEIQDAIVAPLTGPMKNLKLDSEDLPGSMSTIRSLYSDLGAGARRVRTSGLTRLRSRFHTAPALAVFTSLERAMIRIEAESAQGLEVVARVGTDRYRLSEHENDFTAPMQAITESMTQFQHLVEDEQQGVLAAARRVLTSLEH
jgi:hypothetical protein